MSCPYCETKNISPVGGGQIFCGDCGKIFSPLEPIKLVDKTIRPVIAGRQKTRWLLPDGQVIEFYTIVDNTGLFWTPTPVMMHILKKNGVDVTVLQKKE